MIGTFSAVCGVLELSRSDNSLDPNVHTSNIHGNPNLSGDVKAFVIVSRIDLDIRCLPRSNNLFDIDKLRGLMGIKYGRFNGDAKL